MKVSKSAATTNMLLLNQCTRTPYNEKYFYSVKENYLIYLENGIFLLNDICTFNLNMFLILEYCGFINIPRIPNSVDIVVELIHETTCTLKCNSK